MKQKIINIISIVIVIIGGLFLFRDSIHRTLIKIKNPDAIFIMPADAFAETKYAVQSLFTRGDDSLCYNLKRSYIPLAPEETISDQINFCTKKVKSISLLIDARDTKNPNKCLAESQSEDLQYYLGNGWDFCNKAVSTTDWPDFMRQFFLHITGDENNFWCDRTDVKCEIYTENIDRLVEFYNIESTNYKK